MTTILSIIAITVLVLIGLGVLFAKAINGLEQDREQPDIANYFYAPEVEALERYRANGEVYPDDPPLMVRIAQDPVDWSGERIPIENFPVGSVHRAQAVMDPNRKMVYALDGTIWLFAPDDVEVLGTDEELRLQEPERYRRAG